MDNCEDFGFSVRRFEAQEGMKALFDDLGFMAVEADSDELSKLNRAWLEAEEEFQSSPFPDCASIREGNCYFSDEDFGF
jgi:hypothetical protein